jgi:RimJ/RimL family protein N-acetyltransferase
MAIALRTPRLLLREWRDEDIEPFAEMSADPAVMQFFLPFADRKAMDAWVVSARDHWQRDHFGKFAVELPGECSFIGTIGIDYVPEGMPFAPAFEVSWRLARPYWGQGLAYEGARAAIDDGLHRLGFGEVIAVTTPPNRRSWQLMERLGMARDPDSDFDHPRVPRGHPLLRHVLYRLRRREP